VQSVSKAWRNRYELILRKRAWLKVLLFLYGALIDGLLLWSIHTGNQAMAASAELLASQLPVFFTGWLWEDDGAWTTDWDNPQGQRVRRNQLQKLDPHTQSFGLAPMAICAATAMPYLPHNVLFTGSLWWVFPLAMAPVSMWAAAQFRKGERDFDFLRSFSPTKLLHNGVAFTVLCNMVLWVVLWLLPYAIVRAVQAGQWTPGLTWLVLALAGGLLWLAAGQIDGRRAKIKPGSRWYRWRLAPEGVHQQCGEDGRRIFPELRDVPTVNQLLEADPDQVPVTAALFHTRLWPMLIDRLRGKRQRLRPPEHASSWPGAPPPADPPTNPGPKRDPRKPG
jgi:hypothetical protein